MCGGARGKGERGGRGVVHRQDEDLYTLLSVGYKYPVA